jgi:hypothetical protein
VLASVIFSSRIKKKLNGKPALSYAHCEGKKETVSSSHHVKFAIQQKKPVSPQHYIRKKITLSLKI